MAVQSATFADIHLSEEDIKSRFIQPALEDKGWDKFHMRLEYPYTPGQIIVQGSMKHRKRGKRVDYLLFTEDNPNICLSTKPGVGQKTTHINIQNKSGVFLNISM